MGSLLLTNANGIRLLNETGECLQNTGIASINI